MQKNLLGVKKEIFFKEWRTYINKNEYKRHLSRASIYFIIFHTNKKVFFIIFHIIIKWSLSVGNYLP